MSRKNLPDAKNRILQAALKVFAEKSFEGSRIDEVAEEAKVPKSLIYYHFKNKDEILEVLIQKFIHEYSELLQIAGDDTHQTKAESYAQRMQHHYREFSVRNADLIRVILMDSLKKSVERPVIYRIVEALVDMDEKFALASGRSEIFDRQERLVAEFFTNLIPGYAFLCFAESWTSYFGVSKDRLSQLFVEIMAATHGAYHKYHK